MRTGPKSTRMAWLFEAIKTHNSEECLLWPFGVDSDGYARSSIRGKQARLARVVFHEINGHWPTPLVRHTCDNPRCVNPRHLIQGTAKDNMRDALERNRIKYLGENQWKAKLTENDISIIRSEYVADNASNTRMIADCYGISTTHVYRIVRKLCWKHVI